MEVLRKCNLMYKLNKLTTIVLMPVMIICCLFHNSALNKILGGRIETVQYILAICIISILAYNLISDYKNKLIPWIKSNKIILIYFVVRFISLWQCGFEYSVLRSVFFEVFYLIGICTLTIGSKKTEKFYVWLYICVEFIITAIGLMLFYLMPYLSQEIYDSIIKNTYFMESGIAMLVVNINTIGIMAGFGIVLAMVIYGKSGYNKKLLICFVIYNIIILFMSNCRSAQIGIIMVLVFLGVSRAVPRLNPRKISTIVLALMVLSLVPIYGMIGYFQSIGNLTYTPFEERIDDISSGRYAIWKECFILQKDDLFFGKGNIKLEIEEREKVISNINEELIENGKKEINPIYLAVSELSPHNGYIGMISATGIVGFILFVLILYQKIKRAPSLKNGKWYLALIFIFTINCFEYLFVLSKFFTCAYMFLILEADWEDEK